MTAAPDPNTPLEDLPNLGKTTVMWLRAIGIRSCATLEERGIYWAYERMLKRGFRVTNAVLFSLEGALQGRPWRSFENDEKDMLLTNLRHFLSTEVERPLPQAAPRKIAAPRKTAAPRKEKQVAKPITETH